MIAAACTATPQHHHHNTALIMPRASRRALVGRFVGVASLAATTPRGCGEDEQTPDGGTCHLVSRLVKSERERKMRWGGGQGLVAHAPLPLKSKIASWAGAMLQQWCTYLHSSGARTLVTRPTYTAAHAREGHHGRVHHEHHGRGVIC